MSVRVLLLLDAATLDSLAAGAPPASVYSHDQNLFQFGHESLRRGWRVAVAPVQADAGTRWVRTVRAVYPYWEFDGEGDTAAAWAPEMVVAVHTEALNLRRHHPDAKLVAIQAAVHWVESPQNFGGQHVFDLATSVRYNIDFVLTQNARMAELLGVLFMLLARWPHGERIMVAPLGLVAEARRDVPTREVARREMRLGPDAVAIVNAGGTWRWTDFATTLQAFGEHCEAAPDSPLRLFAMGLTQPGNTGHAAYVGEVETLLYRFRALLGTHLFVQNHWAEASRMVSTATAAADIGLNVNQAGLEAWQSFRLRLLDYMAAGLPVLQTRGDLLTEAGCEHALLVRPGDVGDHRRALDMIVADRTVLEPRAAAMRALAATFDSRATYGAALDRIARTPRRADGDHAAWGDCVLDYAAAHVRAELAGRLRDGLGRLAGRLLDDA